MKKTKHLNGRDCREDVGNFFEKITRQTLNARDDANGHDGLIDTADKCPIGIEIKSSNSRDPFIIDIDQLERHLSDTGFLLSDYLYVLCSYGNSIRHKEKNRRAISRCSQEEIPEFLFRRMKRILIIDINILRRRIKKVWKKLTPPGQDGNYVGLPAGKIFRDIKDNVRHKEETKLFRADLGGLFIEEKEVPITIAVKSSCRDLILSRIRQERTIR